MTIHFVCLGNTYRSRMAEAYFNSLDLAGWRAVSSGIEAEKNLNGPIAFYTRETLENNGILRFTASSWAQTTRQSLEQSDLVVFMDKNVYELCQKRLRPAVSFFDIWDIRDITSNTPEPEIMAEAGRTFLHIKHQVDELINNRSMGRAALS